jgi:outer membrane protein OmpA-like peptidoglycan-associated protein
MFDEQDSEINLAIGMVLAVAIFVSLMVIGVALSVSGTFGGHTLAVPAAAAAAPAEPAAAAPAAQPAAAGQASIYFELNAATPPASAPADLAPIIDALHRQSDAHAVVSGFHDASGDADKNAELAKQRAFAVRDALVAAGVAAERIELAKPAETVGGADPAQARRVDVTVR